MKKYDCIVVGAGPAGVAASKVLKDNKISYCVIDKNRFPREKLCGGGLTNKSVRALKELNLSIKEINTKKCDELTFIAKGVNKVMKLDNPITMTERWEFDFNNFKQIKDKNVFEHEEIKSIKDNILITDKDKYEFKYIIFADGVNGYSRRFIKDRKFGFCVEYNASKLTDKMILDFECVKDGYGWVFPKAKCTNIGLGTVNGSKANYKKLLIDFAKKNDLDIDENKIKGYHIPLFDEAIYKKSVIDNKYILVGDAASLTDQISGEGIYYALTSGKLAALSIVEVLKDNKDLKSVYFDKTKGLCTSLKKRNKFSKLLYSKRGNTYIKLGLSNKYFIKRLNRAFG